MRATYPVCFIPFWNSANYEVPHYKCFCISLTSEQASHLPVREDLQCVLFTQCERPSFTHIKSNRKTFTLRVFNNPPVYRVSQQERSIFWEVIVSVILSKKVYMYMCPIPNVFQHRAISLYSSKIVYKKEILRTVSNTSIYCSSDKVGTVYLV
jgi:hypothetical protein